MSDCPKPGAVLFAKDLPRMALFYEAIAQLAIVVSERDVVVLESDHQSLVLHAISPRIAKGIVIASPPKRREDTAVKLVFAIASLADARRDAPALGGALDPPEKEFEARGFRACDAHDPEGNVVQFRVAAGA